MHYGSTTTSGTRRGPLPVQWQSRRAVFAASCALIVTALCLIAASAHIHEQEILLVQTHTSSVLTHPEFQQKQQQQQQPKKFTALHQPTNVERAEAANLGNDPSIDQDVQQAEQDEMEAQHAQQAQAKGVVRVRAAPATTIDQDVAEAQKQAQIAAAALGSDPDSSVYVAEAQKQAAIATQIANDLDSSSSAGDDLAEAQKQLAIAQNAAKGAVDIDPAAVAIADAKIAIRDAGPAPPKGSANAADDPTDYAKIAEEQAAIAEKDSPGGMGMDDAQYAEKEAAIAIRDAGGAGGAQEAEAQKAIAVAAAAGENDYVSAARRAADQAMANAEMTGTEPDWANEAKKELAIAVQADNDMGLSGVKVPADLVVQGAASGAAASGAAAAAVAGASGAAAAAVAPAAAAAVASA